MTFTTVDTVVAPDVPVTVIAAGPAGVPDGPGPALGTEPTAPHPAISAANPNDATHIPKATRRRGGILSIARATAENMEGILKSSRSRSGPGPVIGRSENRLDLTIVETVTLIVVPVGPGATCA